MYIEQETTESDLRNPISSESLILQAKVWNITMNNSQSLDALYMRKTSYAVRLIKITKYACVCVSGISEILVLVLLVVLLKSKIGWLVMQY